MSAGGLEVVTATSGLTAGDPTRNRGIRSGSGGDVRFAGLTAGEADRAVRAIEGTGDDAGGSPLSELPHLERFLVKVDLAAILTDGAGPHLLDDRGHLAIVVADHPQLAGTMIVMGEPHPEHTIGLVAPDSGSDRSAFVWRWIGRRDVAPADRIRALDDLDGLEAVEEVAAWVEGGPAGATR